MLPRRISILGAGIMGLGLGFQLAKRGHSLQLLTRSPERVLGLPDDQREVLQSQEVEWIHDPKELREAQDLVILCLTEDEVVLRIFQESKVLQKHPKQILDTGTTSVELTLQLHQQCQDQQIPFLDSPMTGSKLASRSGQIVFMVGAQKPELEPLDFFFEACAKAVHPMGKPGDGQRAKIALNLIQAGLFQVYVEGFLLAKRQGIGTLEFLELLKNSAAQSPLLEFKMRAVLEKNFETHFSLKNMNKDRKHAMHLAKVQNLHLPLSSVLEEIYENGLKKGWGELDYSSLAQEIEL